jgi:hypothetical protein
MPSFDDLIHLPVSSLRRRLTARKVRGPYSPLEKRTFSRGELADFLIAGNYRSSRALMASRKSGEPKVYDYQKEFGSWAKAIDEVFGKNEGEPPQSRLYLVKAVIEFGLWTRKRYQEVHVQRPDVLPSLRTVVREFGNFGVLKRLAAARSLSKALTDYFELMRRIGRRPTVLDCSRANLDLKAMRAMFGGKRQLDQYLTSGREDK